MSTVGERMGEALLAEALEMAGTHNRPFHDGIRWAALCLISGELDHLELTDHAPRETWTCTCGNSIEVPSKPRFDATNEAVAEWKERHTGCAEPTNSRRLSVDEALEALDLATDVYRDALDRERSESTDYGHEDRS